MCLKASQPRCVRPDHSRKKTYSMHMAAHKHGTNNLKPFLKRDF
ncbi:hypothetical protein HAL07_01410 [Helicobacter ailurogastricus]|uniref:Uncharacterized protein n=1 Tax=Helicobacter ailurogastricus TaxID=1578720 RepID=A0A0K2X730_9HELI|nr:hypothetical protein HAL011_07840 [Helicobacter ailurogastricus]CRF42297.1 hypothetical protein HAL013_04660 [Helicobacter ailurogastricus]CRF44805.1 hypothetical protein HAL09_14170 [Helicobacter ailurogastricus]CRF52015.1 hypothetical protein HAL07_01410 [Helicobacter ailurogastricus]